MKCRTLFRKLLLPWPDHPPPAIIGYYLAQPPSGRAVCVGGVHPQYHFDLLPVAAPFGETERT